MHHGLIRHGLNEGIDVGTSDIDGLDVELDLELDEG